jgi:DNA-binding IclR family transcriptional regulator
VVDELKSKKGGRQKGREAGMPIVRSVERAGRIMEALLAAGSRGKRVSDLSAELGLHKTTVVRLLRTLVALRLARKEAEGSRYRWDPLAWAGGIWSAREAFGEADWIRAALRSLVEASGEAAALAVPDATQRKVRFVGVELPEGEVNAHARPSGSAPMYATASGKVFLSELSSDELNTWLKVPRQAMTEHTITSPAGLRKEVARCRERGYGVQRDECTLGAGAVAVSLRDEKRRAVGVLAITALTDRMTRENVESWVPLLRATAGTLSQLLYPGAVELPDSPGERP